MLKLKLAALAVVAIVVAACNCEQKECTTDPTLNIGSYNIYCGFRNDQPNPWDDRSQRMKNLILFYEYDIVGLQEVTPFQMAFFRSFDNYSLTGLGRDGGDKGEHSAIMYREDIFTVLDTGTFWLSTTPAEMSMGWDAEYPRIVTWAKFEDTRNQKQFYFFNTHFDHVGAEAQLESAKLVVSKIKEITGGNDLPVFFTGDLNSDPQKPQIAVIKEYLTDAKEISATKPYSPNFTYSGHEVSVTLENRERGDIDWIFVNDKVEVLKFAVLTDNNGEYFPSDHLPVWAQVRLK